MSLPFTHTPIQGRTIRLLNLLPGQDEDPVECELFTADLDSKPSYEALSYVWGHPHEREEPAKWVQTKDINLNGELFAVQLNLFDCFQSIRSKTSPRTLWIDAICIDQHDMEEKSSQIQLMGEIYRNSWQTIIWLGADRTFRSLPARLKDCGCGPFELDGQPPSVNASDVFPYLERLASNHHVGHSIADFTQAYTLLRLFAYTWWSRVWVVQEVLLSGSAFLTIGKHQLSWKDAQLGVANLFRHYTTCCRRGHLAACRYNVNQITSIARRFSRRISLQPLPKTHPHQMLSYLWLVRNKEATLLHDKVYSILGLLPEKPSIKPDYFVSWQDLCSQATREIIRTTESADVLRAITRPSVVARPDWPTWSHDWGLPISDAEVQDIMDELTWSVHHASGSTKPQLVDAGSSRILAVTGFIVDVLRSDDMTFGSGWRYLRAGSSLAPLSACRGDTKEEGYPLGGSYMNAFWRTSLKDCIYAEENGRNVMRRAKASHGIAWLLWWLGNKDGYSADGNKSRIPAIQTIDQSYARARRGGQNFSTVKGYIGGNLNDAHQEGDLVVILYGASVPIILRKVQRGLGPAKTDPKQKVKSSSIKNFFKSSGSSKKSVDPPKQRTTYEVIGDCYLHGAMDGELMSDSAPARQEQVFYLV